jgi:oxazoline/thiazoline synthase
MNTPMRRQVIGFKRHLQVEVCPGQGVLVFSEHGMTRLTGEHVWAITPLLDGTRDLPELVRDAPADVSPDQLRHIVETLAEADLVSARPPEGATAMEPLIRATRAYWDAAGVDPASDLSQSPVRVVALGGIVTEPVHTALAEAGLRAVPEQTAAADAALTIVLCLDYLDAALAGVDAAQRAAGKPWLLAKPQGTRMWLGPVFQPPVGGCWHCLARRLWRHRWAEACARDTAELATPAPRPALATPSTAAAAAHLLAHEAGKWMAGHRHVGQRQVWTFDTLTLRGEHHAQPVDPGCPMCGCPGLVAAQAWRPVRLRPRRAVPDAGGCGHRAVRAEEVYAQYRHLISPVTGLIKRIEPHRRGPASLNSYRAGPNVGSAVRDLDSLRATMRAENGGKGSTAAHARTSALCEALERYSGEYRGDEARIRASLRSLGPEGIHPNDCMLFDERQYRDAAAWNATCSPLHIVCEPFDPDEVMDWTPLWSMTRQHHRFLPTAALYYGAPSGPGPRAVRADSNGSAAGSCLEDAVLQGLLEVVERDAVALWWYNRIRVPGIDLNAFSEPWFEQVREIHRELGREVWALDVTADGGIPTAVALSRRTSGPSEDIIFGFGAHLDPCVALRRALAELNQMMPMLVDADAGGQYGCDDPDALRWWRMATVAEHTYLLPDPRLPARRPTNVPNTTSGDLYEDVETLRSRLESVGLEVLILDQTRPDVGLPVVKTVIPGMRPIWARFGPGRLFDVPVRLGWLPGPTPYAELNPTPLFL